MSDSEEDFQSADEGEEEKTVNVDKPMPDVTSQSHSDSQSQSEATVASTSISLATQKKEDVKVKDKDTQEQNNEATPSSSNYEEKPADVTVNKTCEEEPKEPKAAPDIQSVSSACETTNESSQQSTESESQKQPVNESKNSEKSTDYNNDGDDSEVETTESENNTDIQELVTNSTNNVTEENTEESDNKSKSIEQESTSAKESPKNDTPAESETLASMSTQVVEPPPAGDIPHEVVSDETISATDKKEVTAATEKVESEVTSQPSPDGQGKPALSHTADEENVLEKLAKAGEKKQSSGWGSWGSWGSSLLNTAASSIQTFSGQVSEGMHTVVETFEASVGAPPAHKLASEISLFVKEPEEEEKPIDQQPNTGSQQESSAASQRESGSEGGHSNQLNESQNGASNQTSPDWMSLWGVSNISDTLQSKTKDLVESGLDVLETIGKKTMESIKESDPGYMKTKKLLKGDQPNLSQLLREAKEETERRAAERDNSKSLISYSTMFDQHQGLAHLEALEMLSVSCTNKMTDTDDLEDELQGQIDDLAEKFNKVYISDEECEEDHDFVAGIEDAVAKLNLPVKLTKLLECQSKARLWLDDCQKRQDKGEQIEGLEIHSEAINEFAQLTASAMELFHKSGEVLLLSPEMETSVDIDSVTEAFSSLLRLLCNEITIQSHKYNECLNTAADDSEDPESINPMITDVFLEASNSTSYIQDGFKLLLPVVQQSTILISKQNSDDDLK